MKSAGFELFDISFRRYSVAALPAPYAYIMPAQGAWGRMPHSGGENIVGSLFNSTF